MELSSNMPVGFRFHPTDVELVTSYLKPKIVGKHFDANAIAEVDLCESEPWELPQKSKIKSKDRVWWFLCRKDYKYPNSRRAKRTTRTGFWKITGQERKIKDQGSKVGVGRKRTLVFHSRSTGERTNWVMQEIYLDPDTFTIPPQMASYVICKLKMKTDESVDTPGAEIAFVLEHLGPPPAIQTMNVNTEPSRESSFEATDEQDARLTEEDIAQLLSFDADLSEESPEDFANGLICDPDEANYDYNGEQILVGDSSANTSLKRLYFSDAPGGSDTDAEGANGWQYYQTLESSGSFDSQVGSKKVRQQRMSKTPCETLQASVSSRHFVQEQAVAPGSVSFPEKDSSSNANRPEGPVLNIWSVTVPQSPNHAVFTGGNRQKRVQLQASDPSLTTSVATAAIKTREGVKHVPRKEVSVKEPGDDRKAVEKGQAERHLKSASCESSASKWRSVFTLVDTSSLSIHQSRSPLEYWLNLFAGTALFAVFVRELVVFGSWG